MPMFMRRPVAPDIVEAEQVGPGAQNHPQGSRPARPGEWVVTNHSTGQTGTMSNEEFVRDFVALQVPAHMLSPVPGTGPEFQPKQDVDLAPDEEPPYPYQHPTGTGMSQDSPGPWTPTAVPPAPVPNNPGGGAVETFTPMNEGLVGRPAPTPDVKPRLQEPEPITTVSGTPEVEKAEPPNEPEHFGPNTP